MEQSTRVLCCRRLAPHFHDHDELPQANNPTHRHPYIAQYGFSGHLTFALAFSPKSLLRDSLR